MSDEHKELMRELADIKAQLKVIENSCNKMNDHVDFVDTVYERVHKPFHWFFSKIKQISGIGGSAIQLEALKIKTK